MKKQGLSQAQAVPYLGEDQISEIASCAAKLVKSLPMFEAKPLNTKKEINKQIFVSLFNLLVNDVREYCEKEKCKTIRLNWYIANVWL